MAALSTTGATLAERAEEIERERERDLYAARRADRLRARLAAEAQSSAASGSSQKLYREARQRLAYNVAVKLVGEGVLAETFLAPILGIAVDNLRFVAVHVLNGGRAARVPWIPIPGIELPPLAAWEILYLVFADLVLVPLLLLLNPAVITLAVLIFVLR